MPQGPAVTFMYFSNFVYPTSKHVPDDKNPKKTTTLLGQDPIIDDNVASAHLLFANLLKARSQATLYEQNIKKKIILRCILINMLIMM